MIVRDERFLRNGDEIGGTTNADPTKPHILCIHLRRLAVVFHSQVSRAPDHVKRNRSFLEVCNLVLGEWLAIQGRLYGFSQHSRVSETVPELRATNRVLQ